MRVRIIERRSIVHVRDEVHADGLLQDFAPEMSRAERRVRARQIAEGTAILVLEDDFEVVDALRPRADEDDRQEPYDPYEPIGPSPSPGPSPVEEPTWFEVRIVDLHGVPLAGIEVSWVNDGNRSRTTADGDGIVRLDDARGRSATVSITDGEALRAALAEAWSRPSTVPPLAADDRVRVVHYRDDLVGPVMLSAEAPLTISIQPLLVLGRLVGMFFDTDRDFLLPISLDAIAELRDLYDRVEPEHVLVVGHTDTTAQPDYNLQLSRLRAEIVRAYLLDDVDVWLQRYEDWVGRWGAAEDLAMLVSLPDWPTRAPGQPPVEWFQQTRGLEVDGIADEATRRALVTEYMARDGTTLPEGAAIDVHGCGEAYPLDETGEEIDEAPVDGQGDPIDRRVEVFFFADSLGVLPPEDYMTWRRRAQVSYEKVFGAQALEIALVDESGAPIPDARYTARLPIGTTIDGRLDADGRARLERLPEGEVEVDFPDLDRGALLTADESL